MKYSALVAAMFLMNNAEAIKMNLEETELAAESAEAQTEAMSVEDYAGKETNLYPITDQNFNGILGMLGTPTSMTNQLHDMFNQIHFNERVMRQIRQIVSDVPNLVETLCADQDGNCECGVDNNILYGAITDEGKIDYMLGFAQDIATQASTPCTAATFGDPILDHQDMYCWCQTWVAETAVANATATGTAQIFSADQIQGLSSLAQVSVKK